MQPESIIFFGASLWAFAGFVTGVPDNGVPSGYPFLFFTIATIGGIIGITEFVPERVDVWLTFLAAILFVVTPVAFTLYLLEEYPGDGLKSGVVPSEDENGH